MGRRSLTGCPNRLDTLPALALPRLRRTYAREVDILLWLVPPAVVTVVAMVWVSWLGREGRGQVDRDVAVRRLGKALEKQSDGPGYAAGPAVRDRSTGIAVRPSRAARPAPPAPPAAEPPQRRVS